MKRILISLLAVFAVMLCRAQVVRGSIQQGATADKFNIVYLPDHNSSVGEYVNYLSVSVAIPTSAASGVTASIASAGIFSPTISFSQSTPFSYTAGSETIYSWSSSNNTAFVMSWSSGVSFVGATVTLTGLPANTKVRLIDRSNLGSGGGDNGNTFFNVGVSVAPFDLTDYTDFFYAISGSNGSALGSYPNGDKYVETDPLTSLPVGLVTLNAFKSGSKNVVNWTVGSETNNKGFDVQKSTDGTNFSSIGFVASKVAGNSAVAVDYSFDDWNTGTGKTYYRLKQQDIDGKFRLSNIVSIDAAITNQLLLAGVQPNPARDLISVMVNSPRRDKITLLVSDLMGRTVSQQVAAVGVGTNSVQLDVSKLARGSYLIKIIQAANTGQELAQKFVKL